MEEINFDGMIGPTHFFGGLAFGDLASMQHRHCVSNPKLAALQGLKKMKLLADLGVCQAIVPPQRRPLFSVLKTLGFSGDHATMAQAAVKQAPEMYYSLCSSSYMWVANSATVTPSSDSQDGKMHMTIANLSSFFHRNCESDHTYQIFKQMFPFAHIHPPLPAPLSDEGAANHTRFDDGYHLFVYNKELFKEQTTRFPARQTKEASEAIARIHGIQKAYFVRQSQKSIDAGGFHNDVLAVGHRDVYLYHEAAYATSLPPLPVKMIGISEGQLSLKEAIETYFFNSQIVTLPSKQLALISPSSCANLTLELPPIQKTYYVDLSESLSNGGGPACLRLRLLVTPEEKKQIPLTLFLTADLYDTLVTVISKYYRDRLTIEDLSDPQFFDEIERIYNELSKIFKIKI